MVAAVTVAKTVGLAAAAAPDHTVAWLEFWAKVIGAVTWPCAVVILAAVFAGPIRRILLRIVQFEGWGAKATFSQEVVRLAADAAQPPQEPATAVEGRPTQPEAATAAERAHFDAAAWAAHRDSLSQLASAGRDLTTYGWGEPRVTILNAWLQIEGAIAYLYTQMNLPGRLHPDKVFRVLTRDGAIPDDLARKVTDARAIRNKAVHDIEVPSASDAAIYAQAAQELARQIADRALPP